MWFSGHFFLLSVHASLLYTVARNALWSSGHPYVCIIQALITSVQEVMNIIINFTIDKNQLIYHYNQAFVGSYNVI